MMELYPDFWREDPYAAALVESVAAEAALVRQNAAELLAACSVSTAPQWAVELYEKAYGVKSDGSKSLDVRRSAVQALMRGGGIVTPERIRQAVSAFTGGEVAIWEDPENGTFTVEFIGQNGTPAYIGDVTAAIEKIRPAHLIYGYLYRYLRIEEVEAMTLAELETMTMNRFAGGAIYG